MRAWLRHCVAMTALLSYGFVVSPMVFAQTSYQFDLPEQALADSLRAIGRQTDMNIVFEPEAVKGLRSAAVHGQYTADEAIRLVLVGTNLLAQHTAESNVVVKPKLARSSSTDFSSTESGGNLSEIIVTAQKKTERLQDVPVPVTVLDANTLAENNQNRLQDYFASVPGLSLSAGANEGGGQQTLAIRGITTSVGSNPTVGIVIDDVPFGSSTLLGYGSLLYPDVDPSDLAQIEVLRGPQGTLYGASSIGGLIKFVTVDPSTTALSGRVQVLGDDVDHGGAGHGVRASVNVPLSDTFAIRASGFARRDPGYVDNVLTGQNDVNQVDVYGGRLSGLWQPSDAISLKLSAQLQSTQGDGFSAIDTNSSLQTTLGDLKQSRLPGTEAYRLDVKLYTATFKAKLGAVDFTSISGYGENKYFDLGDSTFAGGSLSNEFFPGVYGSTSPLYFDTKKFSQEFRLASSSTQTLEWLAGAFYTHESTAADLPLIANNLATGLPIGVVLDANEPTSLSEYALFGDLTVHFTDRFDIQFGARESEDRQTYNETDTGPAVQSFFGVPSPYVVPTERTRGNAFTYLLTPQFKVSPDLMVYARFSSGYRVGGLNIRAALGSAPGVTPEPTNYAPDETNNYELGVKGQLFDRTLSFDASAYYIDWRRIQITLDNPFNSYVINGGRAKSQGVELSLQARPVKGLTITASATVDDAALTQNFPTGAAAFGFAGDPLPYGSRFSAYLAAEQDILLTSNWTGFIGGSLSYVGERDGEFAPTYQSVPRFRFPAYADMDFRIGARHESWTTNAFVNNAADRRGIVGGGINYAESPYYANFIQPRTIGLSLAKRF